MSSDAAFDYSDEERVTVVSQKTLPDSIAPAAAAAPPSQSLILFEKGAIPSSKDSGAEEYIKVVEVNGKLMKFDASQLKNEEGCIKVAEFITIIIALLLSGNVMGVSGERGFALFVCFIGCMITFSIAMAKLLTLNQLLDSKLWSLLELSLYIGLGIAFSLASLLMAFLCTLHWAEQNPEWQVVPGFASVALAIAALLFFLDACITFYNRRFRSWSPQKGAPL